MCFWDEGWGWGQKTNIEDAQFINYFSPFCKLTIIKRNIYENINLHNNKLNIKQCKFAMSLLT